MIVCALLLSLPGLQTLDAIALEQSARCGQTEHLHTDSCYIGEVLMCSQKAHVHSENCYLVRLVDNDLNWLLRTLEESDSKSLEVIVSTLEKSLLLQNRPKPQNPQAPHEPDASVPIGPEEILAMNTLAAESPLLSKLVFNVALENGSIPNPGAIIVPMDVGTNLGTENHANFYIWLDDTAFVLIGNVTITNNSNSDYATKADIAALYNSQSIVSGITASTLENGNSGTQIRYMTSQPTDSTSLSDFGTNANALTNNADRINFGRVISGNSWATYNPRYATLTTRSGNTYNSIPFYTVKLDYSQSGDSTADQVQYVQSGYDSTLEPDFENYEWYTAAQGGTQVTADNLGDYLDNVDEQVTLYARPGKPREYTVTYSVNGSIVHSDTVTANTNYVIGNNVSGTSGYAAWRDDATGTYYLFTETNTITVTGNKSYTAVKYVNAHFQDEAGNTLAPSQTVLPGQTITLPQQEGCFWSSGDQTYSPGSTVTLNEDTTFVAVSGVQVKLDYKSDDKDTTVTVPPGSYTLPGDVDSGHVWEDSNGNIYLPGDTVNLTAGMTFTERATITINYSEEQSGADVSPGVTQTVVEGHSARLYTMTPREIHNGNNITYFEYWASGGQNYAPGSMLEWDQLEDLAGDSSSVTMTAMWTISTGSSNTGNIVRFFIRLDSKAADYTGTNGSNVVQGRPTTDYSGQIYATHVGGEIDTSYNVADTVDNSFTADQTIRGMVGERSNGMWLYSVPTDQSVLDYLSANGHGYDGPREEAEAYLASLGSIDQAISKLNDQDYLYFIETDENNNPIKLELVLKSDLSTDNYAVRWYVYKKENDGWHIDGRLVKKEGTIRVSKTFQGDANVMEAAKNGFYINAECESEQRDIILKLNEGDVDATGTETLLPTAISEDGLTYEWHIKHVGSKETWKITEVIRNSANEAALSEYSIYSEYSVYDSSGLNEVKKAEYGSEVSVTGVTQAVDEGTEHMLRADFSNYYLRKDSIALKKEDGATGKGLAGVKFEMFHLNMDAPLRFTGTPGNYQKDDNGTITQLETDANGYIAISGFSYDRDQVVFREVSSSVPDGYIQAPDITLQGTVDDATGELKDVTIVSIGDKSTADMTADEIDNDAEYHHAEQMLVVKNHTADSISVTARKEWDVDESLWTDTVTVELYANGRLASNVLPGISPVTVTLNRSEGYTYTWENLPAYVNGEKVVWSIYETRVGEEGRTLSGRFINWLDSYELPKNTYGDDGQLEHTLLVVRNDLYRIRLAIQKTDDTGVNPLAGATFELQSMTDSGTVNTSGYNRTLTTDEKGQLSFEGLADGYYRLTETAAPGGYERLSQPVYIHIDASGHVTQALWNNGAAVIENGKWTTEALSGDIIQQGSFSLLVRNHALEPLPETGGPGTFMYTQSGLALMLAAAALYIYKRKHGKEDRAPF